MAMTTRTDPFHELHYFVQRVLGVSARPAVLPMAGRQGQAAQGRRETWRRKRGHRPLTTYDTVSLAVLGVQSQRLSYRRHRSADFA
jgi:hypothetical protein